MSKPSPKPSSSSSSPSNISQRGDSRQEEMRMMIKKKPKKKTNKKAETERDDVSSSPQKEVEKKMEPPKEKRTQPLFASLPNSAIDDLKLQIQYPSRFYLPVDTMQDLCLCIGDLALLHNEERKRCVVAICWPQINTENTPKRNSPVHSPSKNSISRSREIEKTVKLSRSQRESLCVSIGQEISILPFRVISLKNKQLSTFPMVSADEITLFSEKVVGSSDFSVPAEEAVKSYLEDLPLLEGNILFIPHSGKIIKLKVQHLSSPFDLQLCKKTEESDLLFLKPCFCTLRSKINFVTTTSPSSSCSSSSSSSIPVSDLTQRLSSMSLVINKGENNDPFREVGGLQREIEQIKELLDLSFDQHSIFLSFGFKPPKGILLSGPPGTGKSLLARAAKRYVQMRFRELEIQDQSQSQLQSLAVDDEQTLLTINGPEIVGKFYGESEAKLRAVFERAEKLCPSVIFIDEIDAICGKRESLESDMERRIVGTLLKLMDNLHDRSLPVFVIAATNRSNSLDSALRRPGRFDKEIEIGVPNSHGRREILRNMLGPMKHNVSEEEAFNIAQALHGYVGADISALCREASIKCWERSRNDSSRGFSVDIPENSTVAFENCELLVEDLVAAMTEVRPSALREFELEIPTISWEDIGGQEDIKQKLKEAIEWPQKHPEAFKRMGIRPPRGVVLYGPPGCSKTMLARALANESKLNFIAVKGPELLSKWVGESEKAIAKIFQKARQAAPSIVFFDEVDAIAGQRGDSDGTSVMDRVLSQILVELDGVRGLSNVTVVAATNRPDLLDSALIRPGRMDRLLYVGPPDEAARKAILSKYLRKVPHSIIDQQEQQFVAQTAGFSGADVVAACSEASIAAIDRDVNAESIEWEDLSRGISKVVPRISADMLAFYHNFSLQKPL